MPPDTSPDLANSITADAQQRLREAESAVRGWCGWHIAPTRENVTLRVDGSGTATLRLPTMHLLAVTRVIELGRTLSPESYDFSHAGLLVRRDGHWSDRLGAVEVTIDHGLPDVPLEVTGVVRSIAERAPRSGLKSKTAGPFSETYADADLNDYERRILDHYRVSGDV